jgi:hypothetical protein
MSDIKVQIEVPVDEDGFLELQCPFCNESFKLDVDEVQSEDVVGIFCPYCGLTSDVQEFYTSEVLENLQIKANNIAIEMLNDGLRKIEKESKGLLKVKEKHTLESEKTLYVKSNDFEPVTFNCCGKSTKVSYGKGTTVVYCPYCGTK